MPTQVINVKLVKTDSDLLETCGNAVKLSNGEEWFYMPYWFKKVGKEVYAQYNFENLPKELIDQIVKNRL